MPSMNLIVPFLDRAPQTARLGPRSRGLLRAFLPSLGAYWCRFEIDLAVWESLSYTSRLVVNVLSPLT